MEKRVKVLKDVPEIKLVGRKVGPFREGEEVKVKSWEANILEEKGFIQSVEDFSVAGLRKLLMKEEKSNQLNDLPSHFYISVGLKLKTLRERGEAEKADNLKDALDSLISMRVQKIAKMPGSSVSPDDVPPEEMFLFNRFSQALKDWRRRLDRLFDESSFEEVDIRENGNRGSLQGTT